MQFITGHRISVSVNSLTHTAPFWQRDASVIIQTALWEEVILFSVYVLGKIRLTALLNSLTLCALSIRCLQSTLPHVSCILFSVQTFSSSYPADDLISEKPGVIRHGTACPRPIHRLVRASAHRLSVSPCFYR